MAVGSNSLNTCHCTLPEKRRINIKFRVKPKKSPMKIFQILTDAYGYETLSRAHVFEWYKRFSKGKDSVKDDESTGHQGR
ncbi:hypothetical protein TNCV_3417801 [Trichonephila clavipes]|nr:hypothetical protein TNCV_3417801 [Trichonephila clavipes]